MFKAQAAQLLRSCTGSLSSRTLARSSVAAVRRRPASVMRYYSDGKQSTAEGKKPEESSEELNEDAEKDEVEVSPEHSLLHKLKAEEAKVTDLTSRLRYLQADYLNLQRNSAREKEQARDFAITRFASDLLETTDVLTLALKSVPPSVLSAPDPAPPPADESASSEKTPLTHLKELHEGVEATQRQLLHTLFKHHVKPFDPTGEAFDPNRHEALYQAPVPGKEPGTVLECQQTGFMIKDRVLRAAKVGVVQDAS